MIKTTSIPIFQGLFFHIKLLKLLQSSQNTIYSPTSPQHWLLKNFYGVCINHYSRRATWSFATTFLPQTSPTYSFSVEFPQVFDKQIRSMEEEKFYITLRTNTIPFCIKTLRTIQFGYRDKLKAESDLFLSQNIIALVTETHRMVMVFFHRCNLKEK